MGETRPSEIKKNLLGLFYIKPMPSVVSAVHTSLNLGVGPCSADHAVHTSINIRVGPCSAGDRLRQALIRTGVSSRAEVGESSTLIRTEVSSRAEVGADASSRAIAADRAYSSRLHCSY